MSDEHVPNAPSDPYHIQAAPGAAAIPKLVLKHQDSFLVADRAGDFPAHFDGEFGFYFEGTAATALARAAAAGNRPLIMGSAA